MTATGVHSLSPPPGALKVTSYDVTGRQEEGSTGRQEEGIYYCHKIFFMTFHISHQKQQVGYVIVLAAVSLGGGLWTFSAHLFLCINFDRGMSAVSILAGKCFGKLPKVIIYGDLPTDLSARVFCRICHHLLT